MNNFGIPLLLAFPRFGITRCGNCVVNGSDKTRTAERSRDAGAYASRHDCADGTGNCDSARSGGSKGFFRRAVKLRRVIAVAIAMERIGSRIEPFVDDTGFPRRRIGTHPRRVALVEFGIIFLHVVFGRAFRIASQFARVFRLALIGVRSKIRFTKRLVQAVNHVFRILLIQGTVENIFQHLANFRRICLILLSDHLVVLLLGFRLLVRLLVRIIIRAVAGSRRRCIFLCTCVRRCFSRSGLRLRVCTLCSRILCLPIRCTLLRSGRIATSDRRGVLVDALRLRVDNFVCVRRMELAHRLLAVRLLHALFLVVVQVVQDTLLCKSDLEVRGDRPDLVTFFL